LVCNGVATATADELTAYKFISEGNPHFTSRFCRDKLVLTHNSEMVSESPMRSVGPPTIRFLIGSPTILLYAISKCWCIKLSYIYVQYFIYLWRKLTRNILSPWTLTPLASFKVLNASHKNNKSHSHITMHWIEHFNFAN
jgi:hypothetical protein